MLHELQACEQRNYLIGLEYKERKQEHGGDRKSKGQNVPLKDTAEVIADEQKVSDRTVKRAEKFVDAVDTIASNVGDDARDEILARTITATAQDVKSLSEEDADMQRTVIWQTRRLIVYCCLKMTKLKLSTHKREHFLDVAEAYKRLNDKGWKQEIITRQIAI